MGGLPEHNGLVVHASFDAGGRGLTSQQSCFPRVSTASTMFSFVDATATICY